MSKINHLKSISFSYQKFYDDNQFSHISFFFLFLIWGLWSVHTFQRFCQIFYGCWLQIFLLWKWQLTVFQFQKVGGEEFRVGNMGWVCEGTTIQQKMVTMCLWRQQARGGSDCVGDQDTQQYRICDLKGMVKSIQCVQITIKDSRYRGN